MKDTTQLEMVIKPIKCFREREGGRIYDINLKMTYRTHTDTHTKEQTYTLGFDIRNKICSLIDDQPHKQYTYVGVCVCLCERRESQSVCICSLREAWPCVNYKNICLPSYSCNICIFTDLSLYTCASASAYKGTRVITVSVKHIHLPAA